MDVCEINEDATAKPGEPHKIFYPPATRPGSAHRGGATTRHKLFFIWRVFEFSGPEIFDFDTYKRIFFLCKEKKKKQAPNLARFRLFEKKNAIFLKQGFPIYFQKKFEKETFENHFIYLPNF
jgi:hypothetical protein